jgi:hypothetical protein
MNLWFSMKKNAIMTKKRFEKLKFGHQNCTHEQISSNEEFSALINAP